MSEDRIVKSVLLRAPLARVWAAISDASAFGAWFGLRIVEGDFSPGARVVALISPTQVDEEIAAMQRPHEGKRFEIFIEAVEAERRFSFRWHPFATDPHVDYTKEPTTLVEFTLAREADGVRLTIVESGFEHLSVERRAAALAANDGGWAAQTRLVEKYLARGA